MTFLSSIFFLFRFTLSIFTLFSAKLTLLITVFLFLISFVSLSLNPLPTFCALIVRFFPAAILLALSAPIV